MDTRTGESRAPNLVLRDLRLSRGWGRPRLARELHNFCRARSWPSPGEDNIAKQIYRLETGRVRQPDEFYSTLYCEFFDAVPHDLFGTLDSEKSTNSDGGYRIRSHKFLPAFVGAAGVESVFAGHGEVDASQWTSCRSRELGSGRTLYGWPTGIIVLHQEESLAPASVAELAVWRRRSYESDMRTATSDLTDLGAPPLAELYVLSTYWVSATPHVGARQDTALRMLSMPRVLTSRDDVMSADDPVAHALLVEQSLLSDGFDHPAIVDFGIRGLSQGYASWSGVVYRPAAPDRALAEEDLVSCELSVQAAWAYSDFIRREVEEGRDPVVPSDCGWRYLRGVKSRLTAERPQETSQHRVMRDAIVETSGLVRRLDLALEVLRESSER